MTQYEISSASDKEFRIALVDFISRTISYRAVHQYFRALQPHDEKSFLPAIPSAEAVSVDLINDSLDQIGGLACSLTFGNSATGDGPYRLKAWRGIDDDGQLLWNVHGMAEETFVHLEPGELVKELRALHS